MENVYDVHVHYSFDIPIEETVEIFKEEFEKTGTEKFCFLSLPHHARCGKVDFDDMQNIKGLYLKYTFGERAYAFAHLEHPTSHEDIWRIADDFLKQAKTYLSVGYDGIKMLEGYPSLIKAWDLTVDSPVYDKFYSFMEENGYPIIMHLANPEENWDISRASEEAIRAGRVYDESYPKKDDITRCALNVMKKHPKLKLILAHMGFLSYDINTAEEFMSYESTMLDVTPGGEQLINMQSRWDIWLPFFEKHQDRILYGTDFYAFPKGTNWEVSFTRRPNFVHQFFETDSEHEYIKECFKGVKIDKSIRDKIYRENFTRLLAKRNGIKTDYLKAELYRLSALPEKQSKYADNDIKFMLENFR